MVCGVQPIKVQPHRDRDIATRPHPPQSIQLAVWARSVNHTAISRHGMRGVDSGAGVRRRRQRGPRGDYIKQLSLVMRHRPQPTQAGTDLYFALLRSTGEPNTSVLYGGNGRMYIQV